MDSEKLLRELVDRQAISDVVSAYCERFDRNDPALNPVTDFELGQLLGAKR